MDPHQDSLWRRSPLWRWLTAATALGTALIVLAKPWQHSVVNVDPQAHFDATQVSSVQATSGQVTNLSIPVSANGPTQSAQAELNTALSDPSAAAASVTASPATVAPHPSSSVTWSNATGSISGGGLIAAYCCVGPLTNVTANTSVRSGKHYWELTLSVRPGGDYPDTYTTAGVATEAALAGSARLRAVTPLSTGNRDHSSVFAIHFGEGKLYRNGDVFMFALDADRGVLYYGVNGEWRNGRPHATGGDPVGSAGAAFFPIATLSSSSKKSTSEGDRWIANFGNSAFKYPVPTGFGAYGTGALVSSAPLIKPISIEKAIQSTNDTPSSSFINKTFSDVVAVGGQPVPLPEGNWIGLAFFRGAPGSGQGDTVVLGRFENKRLIQMTAINAFKHSGATKAGFPKFPACERQDYVFLDKKSNEAFGDQKCWWINHAVSIWEQQPVFRAARSVLAEHEIASPQVFVNVGIRRADENGFITALYYFDPAEDGIQSVPTSWRDSEWSRDRIASDPRRIEYVKKLTNWGRNWAPLVYVIQ